MMSFYIIYYQKEIEDLKSIQSSSRFENFFLSAKKRQKPNYLKISFPFINNLQNGSQIFKTNKMEEIQFENFCLSTLPKSNSKFLQKRDIIYLDIPKKNSRIYKLSKYTSVKCIDNEYEKRKQ